MPTSSLASVTDRALARRAGLGDDEAFAQLFERHFPSTYRYGVHMLEGDEALAQDAAQEAWVKAWTHLSDFEGRSQVRTWLFTIVAREVADIRRRRRPTVVDHDDLQQIEAARLGASLHAYPSSEDKAVDAHLWATLSAALTELPWRQRASWLLRTFDQMSYEEIATVLNTTPTVVRGQLHRARRTLAIRMEQWR